MSAMKFPLLPYKETPLYQLHMNPMYFSLRYRTHSRLTVG